MLGNRIPSSAPLLLILLLATGAEAFAPTFLAQPHHLPHLSRHPSLNSARVRVGGGGVGGGRALVMCAADARTRRVFADGEEVGGYIVERVGALAAEAIEKRGHFAMSIGSGTTVAPLTRLAGAPGVDFGRVHVFFGNERTQGSTAFKCFQGAQDFADACEIPQSQVYKVPGGDSAAAADEYEKLIRFLAKGDVLDTCTRTGLPALDLVLLGSGADGHTASLYPGSPQVLISPSKRLVVPADGKGGVTFTLDYIQSAKNVIISAGKKDQAQMVAYALGSTSSDLPAGMIHAHPGTSVEWLLTNDSASLLK